MQNPTSANTLAGSPARRASTSRLVRFGFWTLGVGSLINFNHFSNMTVGTGWPITLGIVFCCALLCLTVRTPLRRNLGSPGFLLVATLTSYLFIGLSGALISNPEGYLEDITLPFRVGLAAFIGVATILGASVELRRLGVEYMLKKILIILTVTCVFILMTPFLFKYVYTMPSHLSDVRTISNVRFIGTYANPNLAGGMACYAVGLALVFLDGNRYRKFATLALILGSMATIVTFSRMAILTLGGLLLLFGISSVSSLRSRQGTVIKVFTIALVGGACVLFILTAEFFFLKEEADAFSRLVWIRTFGRDFEALEGASARGSINNRRTLWSLGWSKVMESPLFGHGLWQIHHLEDGPKCRMNITCGAHNSFLILWGEAGIIPFLLIVFLIGSLLWKALMLPRSIATNAVAVLTSIFIVAFLGADGVMYFPWQIFILGLICALVAYATRESRGRQSRHDQHSAHGRGPSATG